MSKTCWLHTLHKIKKTSMEKEEKKKWITDVQHFQINSSQNTVHTKHDTTSWIFQKLPIYSTEKDFLYLCMYSTQPVKQKYSREWNIIPSYAENECWWIPVMTSMYPTVLYLINLNVWSNLVQCDHENVNNKTVMLYNNAPHQFVMYNPTSLILHEDW